MKIVDCPKVTVVIATFNVGRTISSAIESLINQTYPNWECLVIDGGSKDNTIDILKLYKQKESRVDFISEPDNGIYDAFNKGWKKAKGDAYIAGFNFKETKSVISSFFVGGVSSDNISAEFERCRVMKTNKSMPLPELLIIKNICLKMTLKLWHIFK